MKKALTFIIPIRHPDNANDWGMTKQNLEQTLASISGQTLDDWQCIVVANHGSDLPPMPDNCKVCYVDYPPNQVHTQGNVDKELFYEAFRVDKGRRVLAGMLSAGETDFFMIVDDDDFVHRELCAHAHDNPSSNGWYIKNGYVWGEGGKLLMEHSDFHLLCGTSHIIKSDLFKLPDSIENANMEHVKLMMGSHIKIKDVLEKEGSPLLPLPFFGAVYRIGHKNAHSKSVGLIQHFFFHKYVLKHPRTFFKLLRSVKMVNASKKRDFGEI